MALILDSSGLLAAIDVEQESHREANEALTFASGPLLLSPFVLAELDYMILTRYGHDEELALLDEVVRGAYHLEPFSASDVAEAKAVIGQYAGFGDIDLADGSNVVLARRHDTRDILTLDERHFRALRAARAARPSVPSAPRRHLKRFAKRQTRQRVEWFAFGSRILRGTRS